ncbi:MAG: IS5 family transposase [Planctomycetes bacterium]|nr:IS5 family transposase [Planctomycetota bacterium]
MKPKPQPRDAFELFQSHFDQLLDPSHELILLANKIDWSGMDVAFVDCYRADIGAPAKAVRLMVGLHYLKYAFDESDESVVARWVENPYWQYFCGYTHMQHKCPIHPTSMTKWRNRVGAERLERLVAETIDLAVREKHLPKSDLARVTVDTTVQEKNIAYPTDSKLLYKAIVKLGDAAKSHGIPLRQSYVRVGKRAAVMAGRYAHAKQFKRMHRRLRKLRTYVGRLIRDIRRKTTDMDEELATLLDRADRIRCQQPKDKNKLYSLHEPDVQCISKGKAHKRYEFGQKVAVATTNRSNWIVASALMEDNPYDGHTLSETLTTVERVTGMSVTDAYVDKGYRGHGYTGGAAVHIAGQRKKNTTRAERKRRRRRSAIEPKIGHLKSDHRMGRCFLARLAGDAINAVLAAAGSNLRKLLGLLRRRAGRFVFALIRWCQGLIGWTRNLITALPDRQASYLAVE